MRTRKEQEMANHDREHEGQHQHTDRADHEHRPETIEDTNMIY